MSETYDPQEAGEGRKGPQYVTRRDFKIIGIVLLILAILAVPVYRYMLGKVNESICSRHLHKIAVSMLTYATDNDEHLPFAYESVDYTSDEIAVHNGYAYTWEWALEPYCSWDVFRCPAADDSEASGSADPKSGIVHLSDYGMLNAYSGKDLSSIPYPEQKVLVAESAQSGANGTADPMPLLAGGKPLQGDGNMIGFDDDQNYPDPKTKFATRLAFPNSAKTGFNRDTAGRHPAGIHYVTAGGGLLVGDGSTAEVILLGGNFGRWDVPKPLLRSLPNPGGPSIRVSPPTPKR